ncbi:MAG: BREX system Lon protease-like protein BrxL [Dehalococcoidia bacterium]|nr:BREX system Lon protease-like protein BrxL [Dehalococcoidia bacterium]
MFVNNSNGQRGLVCQYDVVAFDEVSGISFDSKDGVNIMKGYMESGEFSRGKESIRADGGIVMVGNFEVDVEHQQRVGHLFGPMPPEMRVTALDASTPTCLADVPSMQAELFTDHFGLATCRMEPTRHDLAATIRQAGWLRGTPSPRRQRSCSSPTSLSQEDISPYASLEARRRVKEQQKRIGSAEFRNTQFSFAIGDDGVEQFVSTPELRSEGRIGSDPLPPGQAWGIGMGGSSEHIGLYGIEVTQIWEAACVNKPAPTVKETVRRRAEPTRSPNSSSATATRPRFWFNSGA